MFLLHNSGVFPMNFLFLAQSKSLSVFYDLYKSIRQQGVDGDTGFYVAESSFYDEFKMGRPELDSCEKVVKEWDIIEKALSQKEPDIDRLKEYEKAYGDPYLWNALLADRRIWFGEKSAVEQDYESRFTHDQMLSLLQVGIEEVEALFDRIQPDVVVTFICVTIGEYLAYLIARSRNIQFINLRPTRIQNFFFGAESVHEPSSRLKAVFDELRGRKLDQNLQQRVEMYLNEVRSTHSMYEGVLPSSGKVKKEEISPNRSGPGFIGKVRKRWNLFYNCQFGSYRFDTHYMGAIYPTWFNQIKLPWRNRHLNRVLTPLYVSQSDLQKMDYAFYPLHKEPEVTLLVYGRPYLNQIEVIRNFARSLPVGMKLAIKEHPVSVGYRSLSYYKKLLQIPNVVIVDPSTSSRVIVENATVITALCGSIAFEGLIIKKPVVHLGYVPFAFFSKSMVRHVTNLNELSLEIRDLLENHTHDEKALVAYIAAVMQSSVPVDFYSVLLGREGVYSADKADESLRSEHLHRLGSYIVNLHNNDNCQSSLQLSM